MRKLLLPAMIFAALLGTPTLAAANDWRDRDHREWRYDRDDRDWRGDRWDDRRDWRDDRRSRRDWRDHRRWRESRRYHHGRYADRDVVCRTYWHHGYPDRVCYRRR